MKNRNALETLLKKIPGFQGYLEKENRRESDALQRKWLADRLSRSKRAIDEHTKTLADRGELDALPQYDQLRGRIDKLIGRIRGAMAGYSGVFDLVRVDEALLDRVYEHDVLMMERVELIASGIEKWTGTAAQSNPADVLKELTGELDELNRALDRREDLLKGLE
jgi:hypothetical protein